MQDCMNLMGTKQMRWQRLSRILRHDGNMAFRYSRVVYIRAYRHPFPADQWTAVSSKNTLWTDLIQRTMPMGNPFTPRGVGGSTPFPYTLPLDYGNLIGVQQSNNMFDGEIAKPENTGVEIARGVGVGLYDAGKDFVTGIWDFIVNPKESIESVVHAATHPVETFTYLKTAISDSYENDVVNGDAYSLYPLVLVCHRNSRGFHRWEQKAQAHSPKQV